MKTKPAQSKTPKHPPLPAFEPHGALAPGATRALFLRLPETPLSDIDLRLHLAAIPPPSWRALNQVLASRQVSALADAADYGSSERAHRSGGRLAELAELTLQLWRLSGRVKQ
jgi:hypothetical protein